uniref:Nucleolar protein 16 n=1 Tax=Rhabditophanes sp. KR3021 TaxID=114890 RepID=A0AC35TT95_9BILA
MPRSVKKGVKKTFGYSYKKLKNRGQSKAAKKVRSAPFETIKDNWNKKATTKSNLESMGLAYDPNKVISAAQKKLHGVRKMMDVEVWDLKEVAKLGSVKEQQAAMEKESLSKDANVAYYSEIPEDFDTSTVSSAKGDAIIKEIEAKAAAAEKPTKFRLMRDDVNFVLMMINKHKNNYKAMERDPKNLYQLTAKQIERKVNVFKKSDVYEKVVGETVAI